MSTMHHHTDLQRNEWSWSSLCHPKLLRLLSVIVISSVPLFAMSATGSPTPPCGSEPVPAFAIAGQALNTSVWTEQDLSRGGWRPAECLGWGRGRTRLVTALAGEFRFSGSLDELTGRLGRVSALRSMRYWSVSYGGWRELASEAGVLDGPTGNLRADLGVKELVAGRSFHYFENSSGRRAVYRLTVRERTADRLVLATENVTTIRAGLLTLFEPGGLQTTLFLDRRGPGLWGSWQAIRATEAASTLALGSHASYVNRLAALYRHVAGIPTDQEPPAMP